MSVVDDEFDLDVRIAPAASNDGVGRIRERVEGVRFTVFAQDETVAPAATCPADTCGMDCITETCETCGCNTSETCTHECANPEAITFGPYCEDQSDDTCHACGEPGTGDCGDPPDE